MDKLKEQHLKNFPEHKKFRITDQIKKKAKELDDKSDKTEFFKVLGDVKLDIDLND